MKKLCTTKLLNFRDRLQRARDESKWDVADFCLERCNDPIQKMADALRIAPSRPVPQTSSNLLLSSMESSLPLTQQGDDTLGDLTSISDVFDSLNFPWETMWDSFEGSWPDQLQK